MDYIGKKCPVCDKYFHADDDVVVCPECGTPHHRDCYDLTGHCSNESLHAQGYDYQADHADEPDQAKRCPACGKEVDTESFFCKYCGAPLSQNQTKTPEQQPFTGAPFSPFGRRPENDGQQEQNPGAGYNNIPFMDPLGGIPGETDFGDGVTAGETAKYVKQNTPYFIRVFANIKNLNKSRFNFCAAVFTGGYMLYRKMYKLGALFTALQLLLLIVESYITITYSSLFTEFSGVYYNAMSTSDMISSFYQFMQGLSVSQILILYLPSLIDLIRIAMMIVIGICFNRMYFKHCKQQITAIKASAGENENPETLLQTKGGVNLALAISLLAAYVIIVYLPTFISGLM